MKLILDRIENHLAVLISEKDDFEIEVLKKYLPKEVKEGDVLKVRFEIDRDDTKKKKAKAEDLIKRLRQR